MEVNQSGRIEPLNQTGRIIALGINLLLALVLFYAATGTVIPTGSGASVWFLAVAAYWLLTLLAAPFFVPPRDSLSTAIGAVLLLAPLDFSPVRDFHDVLVVVTGLTILLALAVAAAALIAIFRQGTALGMASYRLSSVLGRGEVLFTPAVAVSAVGFYNTGWMALILALWPVILIVRPVELGIQIARYLAGLRKTAVARVSSGTILRVDDPNIVRVSLTKGTRTWEPSAVHVAMLPDGNLNYIIPLFTQLQNDEIIGTGLCCSVGEDRPQADEGGVYAVEDAGLAERLGSALSGEEKSGKIVGIVVERSFIASIRFQVVPGCELEEGMVAFCFVRGKKVFYQILDASTDEENFQQNPFGVHVASAAQLGCYDPDKGFLKFPWLPDMNQPLFLASSERSVEQKLNDNEFLIGHVPCTPFGVPVILDDLIEYHTAVLGITGTGKTELTLDIIRNALARDAKVFCVDFTGEYKARLTDQNPQAIGLTIAQGGDLEKHLHAVETGTFGAPAEKAALKKFLDAIRPQVSKQIDDFLTGDEHHLGIFELAEITNTKATLRTTELYLSAIMDWAKQHRKAERVLIVLEEAHTIIPEAYGSGFDSETQWVVGRIGQIALQGRKYGVGLLLVSQRTALVSKTVLSQCNTYFAHALVDKTSLDYLAGVFSADHTKAIPNLRFLEFVAHGKAVKSERPILAKRDFDEEKLKASRALDKAKAPADATAAALAAGLGIASNEEGAVEELLGFDPQNPQMESGE